MTLCMIENTPVSHSREHENPDKKATIYALFSGHRNTKLLKVRILDKKEESCLQVPISNQIVGHNFLHQKSIIMPNSTPEAMRGCLKSSVGCERSGSSKNRDGTKKVCFDALVILEFPTILGDNPSVR